MMKPVRGANDVRMSAMAATAADDGGARRPQPTASAADSTAARRFSWRPAPPAKRSVRSYVSSGEFVTFLRLKYRSLLHVPLCC